MAKKLISYDDQKPGLGLPDVVEEGLNATYGTVEQVAEKLDKAEAASTYATKNDVIPGLQAINHEDDPDVPRPDVPTSVVWVGSVEPNEMAPGDLWFEWEYNITTLLEDFASGIGGWSPLWVQGSWEHVPADGASPSRLRVSGAAGRRALAWEAASSTSPNVELVAECVQTTPSSGSLGAGLVARGSGEAGSETGYAVFVTLTDVRIARFLNGAYTAIATAPFSATANGYYRLRLRVNGDTISVKAWPKEQPEPDAWTTSINDTAIPAAGFNGVATSSNTSLQAWALVGFADDGGTAPTEATP